MTKTNRLREAVYESSKGRLLTKVYKMASVHPVADPTQGQKEPQVMMGQHPPGPGQYPAGSGQYPPGQAFSAMPMQPQVITQQPHPGGYVATVGPQKRDWSSGLCACCKDPASCLCSFCFPSFYTCYILPRMNENCCLGFFGSTALALMRAKMRAEHGIQGDLCNDACISMFCCPCVLAQLSREIDYVNGQPAMVRQ
ncbi:placenta-specific gene 8 protein-like isoform X1 [Branchiostoma lanceolatum]|uniref:placenta-specific gene 8 protein-like isoform X1 n=2 Tax=Branchiostoma lanceolatum TaxID=7740 RepID=UPI0034561E91